jgi:hypothetical protein
VGKVGSAFSAFENNPALMKRVQGWLTLFWLVMIPVSAVTGLVRSVSYISYLSLIALVLSQGAWWAAASVEARQEAEDVPSEVVEKLVEETDIEPTDPN